MKLSDFVHHVFTVGLGSAGAFFFNIAVIPLITRLYAPEAYAGWALMMSTAILFSSIATLRFELALVLPRSDKEASNLFVICLAVSLLVAAASGLLLPLFQDELIGSGFRQELKHWLLYISYLVAVAGFYQACLHWCVRKKEFQWYAMMQLLLPLMVCLVQIVMAMTGRKDSSGLIIGTLAGQSVVIILMLALISGKYGRAIARSVSWEEIVRLFSQYRVYPTHMTPYTLIGTFRERVPYFLLAGFASKESLGFYGLSSRVINVPNSLLSSAIRPVFFQSGASVGLEVLEGRLKTLLYAISICAIPFWVLFLFHAETLFALFFGEVWRGAGIYAAVLSAPIIPRMLGNWMDRSFDVLGRQRLLFKMDFVSSVIVIGVFTLVMVVLENILLAIVLQSLILTIYHFYLLHVIFSEADFKKLKLTGLLKLIAGLVAVSGALSCICMILLNPFAAIVVNGTVIILCVAVHVSCSGLFAEGI